MDCSLPSPHLPIIRHLAQTHVTTVKLGGSSQNDLCSQCVVRTNLQTRRTEEKQWIGRCHAQASIHPENCINSNNRSPQTTTMDILNLHANLLPVELLLHKVCHRWAIHLTSLPETHPLYVLYHQRRFIKSHCLPLHELTFIYNITPNNFKIISPVRLEPQYEKKLRTIINKMAEESIEHNGDNTAKMRVYTDGSGSDSMAGAVTDLY
jgi:hypothetical protein